MPTRPSSKPSKLLYAGALVRAGMGYASYQQIAELLERSTRMLLS